MSGLKILRLGVLALLAGLAGLGATLAAGGAIEPQGGHYGDAAVGSTQAQLQFVVNPKGRKIVRGATLSAGLQCGNSPIETTKRIKIRQGAFSFRGKVLKPNGRPGGILVWKGSWSANDVAGGKIKLRRRHCHGTRQTWSATLPAAPPADLTATATSASAIDLTWSAAIHATGYEILRSTTAGGPYELVGSPANTAFSDTSLDPGTGFFYVVRATNAAGVSDDSAEASASTPPLPPSAPTGVSASAVSTTSIHVAWDAVAGADSYIVLRGTASGGPYSQVGTPTGPAFDDSGLTANTKRFYVVQAVNTGGQSANSSEASATTLLVPPTGVSAAALSSSAIRVSWTARAGATGYRVLRATASGGPYTQVGTPTGTSFDDTGLGSNVTRFYVVRAINAGGDSADSAEASTTTLLSPPTGVTAAAVVNTTTIHLSWNARSGASGYRVLRSTTTGGPYTLIGSPATTSLDDTSLSAHSTRFYVVRATNAGGDSANSSEVTATSETACTDSGADDVPGGAVNLGGIDGDQGADQQSLTGRSLCGAGDVDWFVLHVNDASGNCSPFDTTEPFAASVFLDVGAVPIHGFGDLDLRVFSPDSSTQVGTSLNSGTSDESFEYDFDGSCFANDSRDVFIKVTGFGGDGNSYDITGFHPSP